MLKYADPEAAKLEAFQYYQSCVDRCNRTKHTKDQIEMIRARKDYQNKAQYARNHQRLSNEADNNVLIAQQAQQIIKLQEKNRQLRKALMAANQQLRLPIDKRDPQMLHKLRLVEHNRAYSGE